MDEGLGRGVRGGGEQDRAEEGAWVRGDSFLMPDGRMRTRSGIRRPCRGTSASGGLRQSKWETIAGAWRPRRIRPRRVVGTGRARRGARDSRHRIGRGRSRDTGATLAWRTHGARACRMGTRLDAWRRPSTRPRTGPARPLTCNLPCPAAAAPGRATARDPCARSVVHPTCRRWPPSGSSPVRPGRAPRAKADPAPQRTASPPARQLAAATAVSRARIGSHPASPCARSTRRSTA